MASNSFQFAFWILFNFVYCLRLIKTINVIEKNSKGKLKRFDVIRWKLRILYLLKGSITSEKILQFWVAESSAINPKLYNVVLSQCKFVLSVQISDITLQNCVITFWREKNLHGKNKKGGQGLGKLM